MGLIAASGGENRINWGLTRMIAALKDALPGQDPLSLTDTQALVDAMATNWYGNVFSAGLLENGEKNAKTPCAPMWTIWKKS